MTSTMNTLPDKALLIFKEAAKREGDILVVSTTADEFVNRGPGRPVYTHELANPKALQEEYEGKRPAPTFEEIANMIPEEKRMTIRLY